MSPNDCPPGIHRDWGRLLEIRWQLEGLHDNEWSASAELGRSFRGLRMKHELSLRYVAGRLKISPMYLSDIERGKRLFPRDKMFFAKLEEIITE